MSNFADEPLTKITVNIYTSDYEWLCQQPYKLSDLIRQIIRKHRRETEAYNDDEQYG
jgi:hypothetical protein